MVISSLPEEILAGLPEPVREYIRFLEQRVADLEEKLRKMEEELNTLKRKLQRSRQNSINSSRPPSSDGPEVKCPQTRNPSGRKPGGRPGHKGNHRPPFPPEQVDEIKEVFPSDCTHCGEEFLSPLQTGIVGEPLRHQVWEVPEPKAGVTEYRLYRVRCPYCGKETCADLPPGVPRGNFGPRLMATVSYLNGAQGLPLRRVQEVMEDTLGVEGIIQKMSESLKPVVDEAREYVRSAPHLNVDETGRKENRKRKWLWTFVSLLLALFVISPRRSKEVLEKVLGEKYEGIITGDSYGSYQAYHKGRRQSCWSPIMRRLRYLRDGLSMEGRKFGRLMLEEVAHLFRCWHEFKEGEIREGELRKRTVPIRARMRRWCKMYEGASDENTGKLARSLIQD